MVYDVLVVRMSVCDMQVWCGCVLSWIPLTFMTLGIVFAIVCMKMYVMVCTDMDYFLFLEMNVDYNKLHWHEK